MTGFQPGIEEILQAMGLGNKICGTRRSPNSDLHLGP